MGVITLLVPKDPRFTTIALLALFGLLAKPVVDIVPVRKQKHQPIWPQHAASLAMLGLLVAAFGCLIWPPPRYLELSKSQREQLIGTLGEIQSPRTAVRIGCSASEEVCVSVAQFVGLLQSANWTVRGNRVERGLLGTPQRGLTMLVPGGGTIPNPDDPRSGVWFRLVDHERDCLIRAFEGIGIPVESLTADRNLAEAEIALIFGPEPVN